MKTVTISPLMGKIQIPSGFRVIRDGVTKPRDQVAKDATFKLKFLTTVKVGGIPVNRYFAVIRPNKGAKTIWGGVRTVDRPTKKKIKKAKRK